MFKNMPSHLNLRQGFAIQLTVRLKTQFIKEALLYDRGRSLNLLHRFDGALGKVD